MDPLLWAKELVLHVLARLPVRKIHSLRLLSKESHEDKTATADSEFQQTLDQAHPNMVAALWYVPRDPSKFLVRIFDVTKSTSQHAYRFQLRTPKLSAENIDPVWTMMSACDGGLVCFVSNWKYTEANP